MTNPKDQLSMFLGTGSVPAKPDNSVQWSHLQQAIFDEMTNGTDNMAVEARAGTGKTTTAVEGIRRMSKRGSVIYCAFNRAIYEATKPKLSGIRNVDIKTLHGIGFGILRQHDSAVQLDQDKGMRLAREVAGENAPQKLVTGIKKAASYAKALGIGTDQYAQAEIEQAIIDADLDVEPYATIEEQAQMALRAMKAAAQMTGIIDFDDQIWLPIHLGLRSKYGKDGVVIDEAQDMNPAQLRLCFASVSKNGRIGIIGDRHQAIYTFRGAGLDTFERLTKQLSAKVFPLNITYRCGKRIVREANKFVPDLTTPPGAHDGKVEHINREQMLKMLQPGDFVISRANAPLVAACTAALRAGIKANIQGRDLGQTLTTLVQKSGAEDVEELIEWVNEWRNKQVEKLQAKDRDPQPIIDRAECLLAFCDGQPSIGAVLRAIATMFEDTDDMRRVVFSSTHRAKGLERDRVFVLRDTYLKARPIKGPDGEVLGFDVPTEEKNLYYVACTRAKNELYFVTSLSDAKRDRTPYLVGSLGR